MKRNAIMLLAAAAYLGWLALLTNNSPALQKANPIQPKKDQPQITEQTLARIETPDSATPTGKWVGLCAKDTIKTTDDFYQAVMADPVLAAYYQSFQWSKAEIKTNPAMKARVSHRFHETITKTAKPIQLPENDLVITDGTVTVRAHCCNDIEKPPVTTTTVIQGPPPTEPPAEILPPVDQIPPALTITSYPNDARNFNHITPVTPTPTPEPGTFLLFGTGLLALAHTGRRRRPK